ncbi:hypothetical protein ACW6AV_003451 [Edwardsiella piscicida]|nr:MULTISPECIES: hypothetical protein [Edwardsiella]EGA8339127.1 hypothetical protein [Salmonella enterica subsp. enterica serovar Saintpaul]EKG9744440.1 hypothetical protein [Salmonella enterica]NJS89699.1 hypothetical protein [Escherichia coli]EKS7763340.1 hypothetical protein [Edwardsiella ictaluri]EKS7789755.1 hypothetical protein [Edwardsiella ictaluri]
MVENSCACSRYVFVDGATAERVEACIGYKMLREPDPKLLSPGLFSLVKLERIVKTGDLGSWSETTLSGPFEATSLHTIPMSYKDQEKQYVSQFLSRFNYLDEVLINAQRLTVIRDGDNGSSSRHCARVVSLSWLLSPPPVRTGRMGALSVFITEVFTQGADLLGFESTPDVLMKTEEGYSLSVDTALGENTIHPDTLVGAGEILPEHGYKPWLMLVYLQQQFQQRSSEFSDEVKPLVEFCDELGTICDFKRFDSYLPLIQRFCFNHDEVRMDAERLGLVSALINLVAVKTDREDFFF